MSRRLTSRPHRVLTAALFAGTVIAGGALIGSAAVGCRKSDSKSSGESQASTGTSGAVQSDVELNAVLATIDGVDITVGEFQDRINRQSPYIRARYTSDEQKREFLNNLIRFEVLAQQAKNEGFDKDVDVVRSMKQVMIQKLMKARFETGISPDDVKEDVMRAYYEDNAAEFHKLEEVRVTAILLDSKAAADKVAKVALGSEGTTNKGFRDLVMANSVDEDSKKAGGDLRYFTQESTELPKEVIDAAFALTKTGDVVGPIKASDGKFYIIKQTGHRKAVDKSFDEVKRQVQNRLYREMRTQAQKDFVETLKSKAKIKIFDDKLSTVKIDTSASSDPSPHGGQAPGPIGEAPEIPGHPTQATQEAH